MDKKPPQRVASRREVYECAAEIVAIGNCGFSCPSITIATIDLEKEGYFVPEAPTELVEMYRYFFDDSFLYTGNDLPGWGDRFLWMVEMAVTKEEHDAADLRTLMLCFMAHIAPRRAQRKARLP